MLLSSSVTCPFSFSVVPQGCEHAFCLHMCSCLQLSILCNFLTHLTNFTHIFWKCNHFKDTKILSNFTTICDCPKSLATTKAEIATQAKLYQAQIIHLEKALGMQKKLQPGYPYDYTANHHTKKKKKTHTNPNEFAISMIKELRFTFSKVSQFCRSHPFLHLLSLYSQGTPLRNACFTKASLTSPTVILHCCSPTLGPPPSLTSPQSDL